MCSKFFSLALSWLLVLALAVAPVLASTRATSVTKQQTQEAKHKKRIVEWGTNKNVSVKLKSGSKVDGRIAEIKDENFIVQLVENGQVVNREVRYGDVEKLSAKGEPNGGKIAAWIALGAAAGVGVLVLIGLALAD
ncbi:MAG: hypothetical protein U0Y68_05580 [Blastocatellia bacterium]